MKSLILYGSKTRLYQGHVEIKSKPPKYFVRFEIFHGSTDEALSKARPQFGETVLNTVSIED